MGLKDFLNEVASGLDSGSIQQKLAEIQQKVTSKEGLDLGGIQKKLEEIQQKVTSKEGLDLGGIQKKLEEIQQKITNKDVFGSTPAAETSTDNNDTNGGIKTSVITIDTGSNAKNIFFPTKAGIALTYAQIDAKGNTEGYAVHTIKDVEGSGKNMTITYGMATLDKNRNPPKGLSGELTFKMVIKDGVLIMDINQMIPAQVREQGALKMEVKGTPMELPNNLQPGQSLKASEVTIAINLGVMNMNTVVKTEGKCVAIEDVKVPAGTFKCYKISQKSTTTAMFITTTQTMVSWYAYNIGTVKTETYDDKDRLASSSVLVEVKGK